MIATIVLAAALTPLTLHSAAHDYYEWRKREFPVSSSDQGFHAYDDRLTDFTPRAIVARNSDPLYDDSRMSAIDRGLTAADRDALIKARDRATAAMHAYADWLEKRLPSMTEWKPIGLDQYEYMLHRILLLPFSAHDVAH